MEARALGAMPVAWAAMVVVLVVLLTVTVAALALCKYPCTNLRSAAILALVSVKPTALLIAACSDPHLFRRREMHHPHIGHLDVARM